MIEDPIERENRAAQAIRRIREPSERARSAASRSRDPLELPLANIAGRVTSTSAAPPARPSRPANPSSAAPYHTSLESTLPGAARFAKRSGTANPQETISFPPKSKSLPARRPSPDRSATSQPRREPQLVAKPPGNDALSPTTINSDDTPPVSYAPTDAPVFDPATLRAELKRELETARDELRAELRSWLDQLRSEAARSDSARLVAMQM